MQSYLHAINIIQRNLAKRAKIISDKEIKPYNQLKNCSKKKFKITGIQKEIIKIKKIL